MRHSISVSVIATALLMVGCGGSGSTPPAPAPVAPVNVISAAADADLTSVEEGHSVTFDASGSRDTQGRTLSYRWEQITTIEAALSGADTPVMIATFGDVEANQQAQFRVTVSDGTRSDSATESVTVTDVKLQPQVPLTKTFVAQGETDFDILFAQQIPSGLVLMAGPKDDGEWTYKLFSVPAGGAEIDFVLTVTLPDDVTAGEPRYLDVYEDRLLVATDDRLLVYQMYSTSTAMSFGDVWELPIENVCAAKIMNTRLNDTVGSEHVVLVGAEGQGAALYTLQTGGGTVTIPDETWGGTGSTCLMGASSFQHPADSSVLVNGAFFIDPSNGDYWSIQAESPNFDWTVVFQQSGSWQPYNPGRSQPLRTVRGAYVIYPERDGNQSRVIHTRQLFDPFSLVQVPYQYDLASGPFDPTGDIYPGDGSLWTYNAFLASPTEPQLYAIAGPQFDPSPTPGSGYLDVGLGATAVIGQMDRLIIGYGEKRVVKIYDVDRP